MNILVIGKDGQLGSEFQAISAAHSQFNFLFTGSAELDITNKEAIDNYFQSHAVDCIINCAAYTAVDLAEDEQESAKKVNEIGVQNLVATCGKHNIKLLHVSTDYVYDGSKQTPYIETDSVNPIGIYGATKLAGEEAILASSIDSLIIRTSWVFSSFGNNFVKTMLRLGKERDSLNVVSDQFGTPTYARDLAEACLKVIPANEWNREQRIYHFSNEGDTNWAEFASTIFNYSGIACEVNPISTSEYPTKAKRPHYSIMSKELIKKTFNLTIPDWKDALRRMLSELK